MGNTQADWARVLGALTNTAPTIDAPPAPAAAAPAVAQEAPAAQPHPAPAAGGTAHGARPAAAAEPKSATPPSVLDLNAYLVYAIGKAARRRLTAKLTEHGLRLWHLTVLTLLSDLGPQSKGTLATRLDMNASDLVKIVNDLNRAGHVDCTRDTEDRRRVVVGLTESGRAALGRLNADIASADEEFLEPLSVPERAQLGSLLRRVHRHSDTTPSHTVHEESGGPVATPSGPHQAASGPSRPAHRLEPAGRGDRRSRPDPGPLLDGRVHAPRRAPPGDPGRRRHTGPVRRRARPRGALDLRRPGDRGGIGRAVRARAGAGTAAGPDRGRYRDVGERVLRSDAGWTDDRELNRTGSGDPYRFTSAWLLAVSTSICGVMYEAGSHMQYEGRRGSRYRRRRWRWR